MTYICNKVGKCTHKNFSDGGGVKRHPRCDATATVLPSCQNSEQNDDGVTNDGHYVLERTDPFLLDPKGN